MIGRADDVAEIAVALRGGGSIVIAGPRRTGKTTVSDAAISALAREGIYTVSVDLFRTSSAADLAEALVTKTIANRSALRRAAAQARRADRLVADAAGTSAVVKSKSQLGEELEIAFSPGLAQRDPERYLDYALELPGRIAAADRKQVIVFFDEFQEMASANKPYGDPDLLTKRMRAIFQRSTDVSYLFAGSIEHLMRDLFAPRQRALSQFGGFHELRPIDPQVWQEGLRERFADDDCRAEATALTAIVERGEGHPRATMLIAQQTHLTAVLLETHDVDLALVEQGYVSALRAERIAHERTLDRVRRATVSGSRSRGSPA